MLFDSSVSLKKDFKISGKARTTKNISGGKRKMKNSSGKSKNNKNLLHIKCHGSGDTKDTSKKETGINIILNASKPIKKKLKNKQLT